MQALGGLGISNSFSFIKLSVNSSECLEYKLEYFLSLFNKFLKCCSSVTLGKLLGTRSQAMRVSRQIRSSLSVEFPFNTAASMGKKVSAPKT